MMAIAMGNLATLWYQQVFALDAKYNSQRAAGHANFGTLYIRRRSQLLREKYSKNPEVRARYLKLRSELLRRRYGGATDQSIFGSRTTIDEGSDLGIRSRTIARRSIAENFAFAGVHHIFDQHTAAVPMIKFANNDRSRLCCASLDGTISICEATTTPPKVMVLMKGHRMGVTAIDWSISNDLIVSSSLDATVRLWGVHSDADPVCLRVVNDQLRSEVLCCAFVPANNNLIIAGNSQGLLQVLNVSTGIYPRGGTSKIGGKILALTCEESGGSLVWAGNDKGIIVSFHLDSGSGRLSKLRRIDGIGGAVTSISWRSWLSKETPWPALLVSSACNTVYLYRVANSQGFLTIWRKYPVKHRQYLVRSTFCPQMGACLIATGSEEGAIHLLDSTREGKGARVNRLQGHAAPTIALSFNYDESLLASADQQGLVILWRNRQRNL
ncbi:WD repeat-containing protein 13-like [Cephus cinctus]|uniref:WD repeat-containing protein 13-like n=1 Tax=Cephus cinctus TaxID=211228 RepID=A0AAJ7VYD9_CEPCN|nr:WD repeat-containing protein 13-like [Cephus cinctus]XP_024937803.1 WD repeat-containing protein 13-like [Cephus cinctus]XP_024937804.1 WD repeat-containing protein 13-like [Cephus cinctus]XP_024937805.1 WD repeat-containing protein 13-like [Cephus cinctus]